LIAAPTVTVAQLIDRYDVFFLDAYGVLVDAEGALPGASEFIRRIRSAGKDYLILSNDASRLPTTAQRRYAGFGVDLDLERILTSGLLLVDHFAERRLHGHRCIVLGTEDSRTYVREAGGVPVDFDDPRAQVIVIADDDDYPFLPTLNAVATVILHRLEKGLATHYVMPNPDLIYPCPGGAVGVCSGAIAALFEAVARVRDPSGSVCFIPLGKPHRPMFDAALRRFPHCDRSRMVMVGDQLGTDILGANRAGLDSVLIQTGISRPGEIGASGARPTWILSGLG
jgi:4-nitrophenyl phosphatase